jgi:hypothetical protein
MREEGANKVCRPKLNDQIVLEGRVRKLLEFQSLFGLFFFVKFLKLSLIKSSW